MSISKFDFDKWWNSIHKGSSPEDMVSRLESQKAWLAVSELYEAEHNNKYTATSSTTPKSCSGCKHSMYCANCGIRA